MDSLVKAITAQMEKIDRSISDVDAILVTHEHSDHIKGIGVLARKYGIPIYANEKTWQAMAGKMGKSLSNNRKSSIPEIR